jgi:trehalose 6-phosphate synthase
MRWPTGSETIKRVASFLLPLVAILALLAWAASATVQATTRRWFERDMQMRGELAVSSARESLLRHWKAGRLDKLAAQLTEIARDERIMAAAACSDDLHMVCHTFGYPLAISCSRLVELGLWHRAPAPRTGRMVDIEGGSVYLSMAALEADGKPLGQVVLVHDVSMISRRENAATRFIWLVFLLLAVAVAAVATVVERLTWRRWIADVRGLLRGQLRTPEFRPILTDVRELIARITAESDSGIPGGAWTAERLKLALHRHLHGERVLIVANREPYIHDRSPDGTSHVRHPASGLVTALEPVMRACSGVWVAHGSGSADREASDREGREQVPPGDGAYTLKRVWLSSEEEQGYYFGFSNEGLWPLAHLAHVRPQFRAEDWQHYLDVNQKFALAVTGEADTDDPIVLVQDYHFTLLPRMIRDSLRRATIITFWHIPWPNAERFGICPWRNELLEGMLGSSIIGFHTLSHCHNFLESADRYIEARVDRERQGVVFRGRLTLVRPYPISIEWPPRWAVEAPPPADCRTAVFRELALKNDVQLGIGIDRLDYTKGIEERLLAVERMLERYPAFRGRFAFAQVAAPSRTAIERYRQLGETVVAQAARINDRFGTSDWRPIHLLPEHHEPPDVYRLYRAADLCYVSSLHDGMNLVAKEFVAARDDERGVLILSSFTGAARELQEALIVNPYDIEQSSDALAVALNMRPDEQRERMHSMRSWLAEFNVYRWAGRMIVDAARLRHRDRLSTRLGENAAGAEGPFM